MVEVSQNSDQEVDALIKLVEGNKVEEVTQQLESLNGESQQLCNTVGKKGSPYWVWHSIY